GGEIFIFKMPAVRLRDLAEAVVEETLKQEKNKKKIKIEISGRRPGEKDHEELMTENEAKLAYECDGMFIILSEIFKKHEKQPYYSKANIKNYSSKNSRLLSKEEIKELLRELKFIK
ncbi:MAG: hypothetical protein DRO04_02090, partial [Candidatus Iainarchaeum archaeon]